MSPHRFRHHGEDFRSLAGLATSTAALSVVRKNCDNGTSGWVSSKKPEVRRKKIQQVVWILPEQKEQLDKLKARGLPLAEMYRQALDVVLASYVDDRRSANSRADRLAEDTLALAVFPLPVELAEELRKAVRRCRLAESERDQAERREGAVRGQLRKVWAVADEAIREPVPIE